MQNGIFYPHYDIRLIPDTENNRISGSFLKQMAKSLGLMDISAKRKISITSLADRRKVLFFCIIRFNNLIIQKNNTFLISCIYQRYKISMRFYMF